MGKRESSDVKGGVAKGAEEAGGELAVLKTGTEPRGSNR